MPIISHTILCCCKLPTNSKKLLGNLYNFWEITFWQYVNGIDCAKAYQFMYFYFPCTSRVPLWWYYFVVEKLRPAPRWHCNSPGAVCCSSCSSLRCLWCKDSLFFSRTAPSSRWWCCLCEGGRECGRKTNIRLYPCPRCNCLLLAARPPPSLVSPNLILLKNLIQLNSPNKLINNEHPPFCEFPRPQGFQGWRRTPQWMSSKCGTFGNNLTSKLKPLENHKTCGI